MFYIITNLIYCASACVKPETHRAKCWPSEVFGGTQISSGTNLFSVFICVGSFWNCVDRKSENVGCWPSEPLDTLIGCVLAV